MQRFAWSEREREEDEVLKKEKRGNPKGRTEKWAFLFQSMDIFFGIEDLEG